MGTFYDHVSQRFGFEIHTELERGGRSFHVKFRSEPRYTTATDAEAASEDAEGFEFDAMMAEAKEAVAAAAHVQKPNELDAVGLVTLNGRALGLVVLDADMTMVRRVLEDWPPDAKVEITARAKALARFEKEYR